MVAGGVGDVVPNGLFVYGTLMCGASHHHLLSGVTTVEPAEARGRLYRMPAGYPAMVAADEGVVHGELCLFGALETLFETLDAYEGDEYVRQMLPVFRRRDGKKLLSWIYVVPLADEPSIQAMGALRIEDGRYVEHGSKT